MLRTMSTTRVVRMCAQGRTLAGLAALVVWVSTPGSAIAHNAGHIFLPDGSCLEIGSFKDAPLVGQDRTQLDLLPQTSRDEFGASFVGFSRDTPILPGACPVSSTSAQKGMSVNSMSSLASAGKAAVHPAPSSAPAHNSPSPAQGGPLFSRGPARNQ